MSVSKALLFICGIAVGGVAVQALPIAVEWRRDYQSARAIERLQARASSAKPSPVDASVDAEFVPEDASDPQALLVKEYEVPFGTGVERRRWKLRAPDDIHQQIAGAMIASRSAKLDQAFNQAAAAGARQSKHAIEEVELPSLRANITLLNNLIASTTQELVDVEVMKQLAIQRAQSTGDVDQGVASALAADIQLKGRRAALMKADDQLAARRMTSRDQNSVEIRNLLRRREQLAASVNERVSAVTAEVKQRFARKPNEKLRAAILEYNVRAGASTSRLQTYREELEKANKRMLSLQRTLEAAEQPPTADSAI
jgi:hypothetical protein